MEIKKLNVEHIDDVYEIINEQFGTAGWTKNQVVDAFLNQAVEIYGAYINSFLIGFIIILITVDDINILELAVKNEFKRRGCAKNLLEYVKSKLTNNQTYSLEVKSKNIPAIKLYEGFGFKTLHVRKRYYKDGDDALCMFYSVNDK